MQQPLTCLKGSLEFNETIGLSKISCSLLTVGFKASVLI
eukprot:COSAG05_NODE_20834_length_276_cov_0.881356_1_plen_38_part_10